MRIRIYSIAFAICHYICNKDFTVVFYVQSFTCVIVLYLVHVNMESSLQGKKLSAKACDAYL